MAFFKKYPLQSIACLALLLRLLLLAAIWQHPERCIANDSASYTSIAANLLAGHGFSSCLQAFYWPDIRRTPVYPLFLSAIMAVWEQQWLAVAFFQVILDTLSCFFIARFTADWYGKRAGIATGIFYATSASSAVFSLQVLSETLCIFLIVCSLIWVPAFQKLGNSKPNTRKKDSLLSAFCWALAVLCKPVVVVTVPFFIWQWWKTIGKWQAAIPVVLLAVLPLAAWVARNGQVSGQYTLSCVAAVNRLQYDATGLAAALTHQPVQEVRDSLRELAHRMAGGPANACSDDYRWIPVYRGIGNNIITSNTVYYVMLHMRGAMNALIPPFGVVLDYFGYPLQGRNTLAVLQEKGVRAALRHYFSGNEHLIWVVILLCGCQLYFFIAVLAGIVKWLRSGAWTTALFWGGSALLLIAAPGMAAEPRMLLPALPFLMVCAGFSKHKDYVDTHRLCHTPPPMP